MYKYSRAILLSLSCVVLLVGIGAIYHVLPGFMDQRNATRPPALMTPMQRQTASSQASTSLEPAPDFVVRDETGNDFRFSQMAGAPVLINFWASWYPPCEAELELLQDMYDIYAPQNVRFMIINVTDNVNETLNDAQAFLSGKQYTFPVYFDVHNDAAFVYNLQGVPATAFIDASGNLAGLIEGTLSEEALRQGMEALM